MKSRINHVKKMKKNKKLNVGNTPTLTSKMSNLLSPTTTASIKEKHHKDHLTMEKDFFLNKNKTDVSSKN